ncbi:urease accessory protein UreD [Deinococcus sp. PESE-13]
MTTLGTPVSLGRRTRTGRLELEFGVRHGQTALLRDLQKAPLMVVRPFRLPCGTLMVFIVNPTGGVLGGDHSEIHVEAGAGTRVLILTQSATRVQPSPGGEWATQELHFHVGAGARLEYYPERTLPFAGSRFRQHLRADLDTGAEFGLLETLASGRVQMGERLAWADYRSEVSVYAAQERVYLDRQHFRPGPHSRAPGVLGGNDYFASGVWVAGDSAAGRPAAESPATAPGWASGLSAGGAVWARGVAATGPALDRAARQLREQVRHDLFGAAPLVLRR